MSNTLLRRVSLGIALGAFVLGVGASALADEPPSNEPAAPSTVDVASAPPANSPNPAPPSSAAPPRKEWLFTGSWRVREEFWDWFAAPGFDNRYAFTGSLLRFGVARQTPKSGFSIELEQAWLIGLPKNAVAPPPAGQLGFGGSYYFASDDQDASLFVKQAFWRVKGLGEAANSLRVGRFEFIEGMETVPKDASLAWLKRERIAHRLIGNFGFSHVGRSLDGLQFVRNTPSLNVTVAGGIPTRGVFDLNGMDTLPDVRYGYAAATKPVGGGIFQGEGRLFGLFYDDSRDQVVKVDNRPPPAPATDAGTIQIGTLGGHFIGRWETAVGTADLLAWGAGQFGKWGSLSHGAFAAALEGGIQPKGLPGKPWFRAGYFHASGDGDPTDGVHRTFFPVLPTPRIYARFPFFTQMNLNDAFVQSIFRPHPKVTLRSDVHALWLADENDLWYSGGGAFQDRPAFGYSGRPTGGSRGLATLADLSVDYQWRKDTTLSAYFGYAFGGKVIGASYAGRNAAFGFLELTHRW
jgi:hypothetical protein